MPPDERSLLSLGQVRLRLLPELAGYSRRIAALKEERDELMRQASSLAAQERDLHQKIERERERLLTRGPIGGAVLAGLEGFRRRQRACADELADRQEGVSQRCRAVEAWLQVLFSELMRARRRLDVIGERIEEKRLVLNDRKAEARLEDLLEDCVRPQRTLNRN